ncbi:MAG: hypothetical protein H0W84_00535 [Bacteroidetes bacterium]|nr:hypothetical protein [Bacteroidota bacterium]
MDKKNSDSIDHWINIGAGTTSGIASNIFSSMNPTIEGAIIGGTLGALVEGTFVRIGNEMKNRLLSKREEKRIGSAFVFLLEKVDENLKNGNHYRKDDFFRETEGDYNYNAEILEGVLITIQKSYEEKKVKFISYFYANIIFETRWDRLHANHFLRLAEEMSYRQFCLLAIYYHKEKFGLNKEPVKNHRIVRYDTMADIHSLKEKALFKLIIPMTHGSGFVYQLPPENASISDYGKAFYDLFDLAKISKEDIFEVAEHLIPLEKIKEMREEET